MRPGARPPVHWIAGPLSARYVALATGGRPPTAKALPEAQDRIVAATAHLATPTAPSTRRICSTPCATTNDTRTVVTTARESGDQIQNVRLLSVRMEAVQVARLVECGGHHDVRPTDQISGAPVRATYTFGALR
jgi:hypothetical protein